MRHISASVLLFMSSIIGPPDALGQTSARISVDSVRVAVRELGLGAPSGARTLAMRIETIRRYGCLGYGIEHEFSRRADTLAFVLTRIIGPSRNVCLTQFAPAGLSRELPISAGHYTVIIREQSEQDLLDLDVTDSSFALSAKRVSFVVPDERLWWRFHSQAMALFCQNVNVARPVCDDVRRWLSTQAGVRELRFDQAGVNPYWPYSGDWSHSEARRGKSAGSDIAVSTFTYADDRILAVIQRCFPEIAAAIHNAVGVSLTLATGNGEQVRASSTRTNDEPHIEMPERVTTGPLCNGAR
jgi:hypothetical protein